MSLGLVGLALLMGAMTYPSRALPLLSPGLQRLPPRALAYLRLVGPAVLAALAGVSVATSSPGPGAPAVFYVGVEWAAVAICLAMVAWRRKLFLGIAAAVVLTAVARALG